jgi:multidrug efflux pump subunit AcrA (membrane-fusion protein)
MWRAAPLGLVLLATSAAGHEGHDHGPPSPPLAVQGLAPRASAESRDFELVAVLDQGRLTVYVDDHATGAPVENAALEVESGPFRAAGAHGGQGVYRLDAGPLAAPGRHDLVFTVQTPTIADLLPATLEVPTGAAAPLTADASPAWYASVPLLQGAVVLLALCVLFLLVRRDRRATPPAALVLCLLALWPPGPAGAHEGHDHGAPAKATAAPVAAAGEAAQRQPDGALFVPKPVQRLLGLRTVPAEPGEWPDTFTLTGHVVADPNASALVQAPLRGRIELPEGGLPQLGAWVRQGQILARLAPILDAVDHTTLQAELAQIDGRIAIVSRNLERLRQLGINAPRQDLEQTDAELASLVTRRKAISDRFSERLPLTAPVSGVLALRNASPGQIVAGGDTLFTLLDPQRLWVEALLYDTDHASHFTAASARTADGQELRLTPLGTGYELRGHALPIQFRIEPRPADTHAPYLAVRQPLTVVAQMHHGSSGLRIPARALQKAADGTDQVWVRTQPEQFRPQRVEARDLGGGFSVVTRGLTAGDRVVTDGASLLSQVR